MGPHDGGVDRDVPIDLPGHLGLGLNLLEQAFPGSAGRPQAVTFADRLPRAEPFGQATPLIAGPPPTPGTNPLPAIREQALDRSREDLTATCSFAVTECARASVRT